jgi:hypothetical protein
MIPNLRVTVSGLALAAGLMVLVIAGGCVTNGTPGKNVPATPAVTDPRPSPVPPASPREITSAYCYIQEVQPGYIPGGAVINLTSDDFRDFPLYGDAIGRGKNNTGEWYNGYRFVSDFNDDRLQLEAFRNVSCRNSRNPACDPVQSPSLFAYGGQYFQVSCLPGFGNHAPTPPYT